MKAVAGLAALALVSACTASTPAHSPALRAVARFDGSHGDGMAPDTERFDGTGSEGPAGYHCRWDFGDGQAAPTCLAEHTYAAAGDFRAQLTVSAGDQASTAALEVHVEPAHGVVAVARFSGTSGHGLAPDDEAFDGTGSRSLTQGATLARCQWDFGDGTRAEGCRLEHLFLQPGQYTITLTATDSAGDSARASLGVKVDATAAPSRAPTAIARLDGTPGKGAAPDPERFDGTASHTPAGGPVASCEWDFGDGGKATGCKASHTFELPGPFVVRLAVRDADGHVGQTQLPVEVEADGALRWALWLPAPTYAVTASPIGEIVTGFAQDDHTMLERVGPDGKERGGIRVDALALSSLASSDHGLFAVGTFVVDGRPPAPGFAQLHAGGASTPLLSACDGCGVGPAAVNAAGDWAAVTYVPGRYQVRYQGHDGAHFILQGGDPAPVTLDALAVDGSGEVIVAGSTETAFDLDGQHFEVGPFLARLDRAGKVEWAHSLVGATGFFTGVGTTAGGTIFAAGTFFGQVSWAGQSLQPGAAGASALLVTDPAGAPKQLRALPLARDLWRVAVDPLGQLALAATTQTDCGAEQLTVIKLGLDGDPLWTRTLAPADCQSAVRAHAVTIVGHEVIVAGELQGNVGFGPGTANGEGYLIDLGR